MLLAVLMSIAVQGVVVAKDGSPLPGVAVTIEQAGWRAETVTDADGRFIFPNVSPNVGYRIRAVASGLETREVRKRAGTATVNIKMVPITIAEPVPMLSMERVSTTTFTPYVLSKLPF